MATHDAPGRDPFPCDLERWGACRLCDLLDRQGPHYQEGYRRAFFPSEFPCEPPGAISERPAHQWPEQGQPPSVRESLRLLGLMKQCPWREAISACGCLARCSVGLGVRGMVNHRDCFECLAPAPDSPAPPPPA